MYLDFFGVAMIDPNDYWVNNPLITPINKALMYDNAIWMAKMDMKDDIKDRIMERVNDLKSCGKNDSCWEFGDLIESYIEEWLE